MEMAIHSAATDTSFDTKFQLNNVYEDKEEVGAYVYLSYQMKGKLNFQPKSGRKTHGITIFFNYY